MMWPFKKRRTPAFDIDFERLAADMDAGGRYHVYGRGGELLAYCEPPRDPYAWHDIGDLIDCL